MTTIGLKFNRLVIDGARTLGTNVSSARAEQMASHARELLAWNRRVNLTAITEPSDMAIKHFVDSIAPMDMVLPDSRLLDIGSGGGFPGIPLKIMIPSLSVTMIDASRKKVSFLLHVIRTLGLANTWALHARAESLPCRDAPDRGFDVIVSRALTDLVSFTKLGLPLLAPSGYLLAYKGSLAENDADEMYRFEEFINSLPARFTISTRAYRLPRIDAARSVVMIRPEPTDQY